MNFAERFCAQRKLAPEQYEREALRCSLHAAARVLRPLLDLAPGFFEADRLFVRDVGRIARFRDFDAEARDYTLHPSNRGFLRRQLRLRISVKKMQRLVLDAFANAPAPTVGAARSHEA